MERDQITRLAEKLLRGEVTVDQLADRLAAGPTADVGEARLDLDRQRRCGFPEVVYGPGKSVAALEKIFRALMSAGVDVLATRVSTEQAAAIGPMFPTGRYNPTARTFRIPLTSAAGEPNSAGGHVAVLTAGTSDLPVAEEAMETLLWMGVRVTMIPDVGVAGPHRLPERLPSIAGVDAVVVIAGMEGALPSVVGGYVDCPVVGVPTSVGYGASLGGISALLSMLNSCAANVTVVNIDAGFKGGYVAGLIARKARKAAP